MVPLLVLAIVAGCSSGGADVSTTAGGPDTDSTAGATTAPPTTSAPETTTTAAPATTEGGGGSVSIDDVPESCVEVISALIGLYEPHMGDVDWQTATIEDHINLTLALAGTDASAIPDATQCQTDAAGTLDFTGQTEEGAELFLAIAERESPEVASYFSVILEARQQVDKESTGDCQTDIATFQGYVDGGVPFMELQLGDQLLILGLMNSIGFCSLQTQGELMFAPATQEFLAGSPFAGE